ncbi:MAG: VWA domain-containing protein [Candidatus Eremiobacteraeota bacterium]|nr:VWA domain-containing protein [Candidatus Eremiobacteraeota bacterium]
MTFSNPPFLIVALLSCAAFYLAFLLLEKRKTGQEITYSNLPFLVAAARPRAYTRNAILAAWLLGVVLLGAALAGPRVNAAVPAKDAAAIICVDTSGSMAALDVAPNRSQAAKDAARAFVAATAAGTKIGIVAFSSSASVVQPRTADRDMVRDGVERIPEPNGATAIGDALALAGQQLPAHGHRLIVLITDGVNNRGVDPLEVAKSLGRQHVPVYTIGIGTNDSGQLIPGTNEPANIDEDALRAVADTAGGTYARVADAGQLRAALAHLGASTTLERRKIDAKFPFAVGGATVMVLTFLVGFGMGKIP